MMYWNGDWNWGAWLGMTAMMVVFWGAVAWAIVAAVRGSGASRPKSTQQILEERLAHGEITVDEYESLHAAIAASRNSDPQP